MKGKFISIHKPHDETDQAKTDGTEASIEEVLEVGFVDRFACLIEDEENQAQSYEDVEYPTDNFDKDSHISLFRKFVVCCLYLEVIKVP